MLACNAPRFTVCKFVHVSHVKFGAIRQVAVEKNSTGTAFWIAAADGLFAASLDGDAELIMPNSTYAVAVSPKGQLAAATSSRLLIREQGGANWQWYWVDTVIDRDVVSLA